MDRGTWQATVHGVTESWTTLNNKGRWGGAPPFENTKHSLAELVSFCFGKSYHLINTEVCLPRVFPDGPAFKVSQCNGCGFHPWLES